MRKSISGLMVAAGPILALVGGTVSITANSAPSTPDTDWIYDCINGIGALTSLAGLVMFFTGAMHFSRRT